MLYLHLEFGSFVGLRLEVDFFDELGNIRVL